MFQHKQRNTNITTREAGFPSGTIRQNRTDTEKISMAPAQGRHAHIEKCKQFDYGCYRHYMIILVVIIIIIIIIIMVVWPVPSLIDR